LAQFSKNHFAKTIFSSLMMTVLTFSIPTLAEDQDTSVIKMDAQEELQQEVGLEPIQPLPVPPSVRNRSLLDPGNVRPAQQSDPRYQVRPRTNRQARPVEEVQAPKKQIFSVQSELLAGSSSNVARFEGAPAGSFVDFSPRLLWTPNLGEKVDFALSADAFLRTFQDPEIDDLFRSSSATGSMELTYFFNNRFFAGVDGQITRFDGRGIDFSSPNNSGRDEIFTNNQANLIFGRDIQDGFVAFNIGQAFERADATAFDEAGNQFFTDFNQTQGGVRLSKQFSNRFSLQAGYQLQYREFLNQRARLPDGQVDPDFFAADLAEEIEHVITAGVEVRPVVLELNYNYVGDLVAGAETRYGFGAVLAAPFEPVSFLFVRPEVGIQNTLFENFVGDVFRRGIAIGNGQNPSTVPLLSDDKRNDITSFYGIEVVIDAGLIKPVINARHTEVSSNYSLLNFEEDMVSGGIRLQF
jgi:hypothetical protein